MMLRVNKHTKKIAVMLAVLALFFCLDAALLEAGNCEKAVLRCLNDPFLTGHLGAAIYCLTGYIFCKKYLA